MTSNLFLKKLFVLTTGITAIAKSPESLPAILYLYLHKKSSKEVLTGAGLTSENRLL